MFIGIGDVGRPRSILAETQSPESEEYRGLGPFNHYQVTGNRTRNTNRPANAIATIRFEEWDIGTHRFVNDDSPLKVTRLSTYLSLCNKPD